MRIETILEEIDSLKTKKAKLVSIMELLAEKGKLSPKEKSLWDETKRDVERLQFRIERKNEEADLMLGRGERG